MRGRRSCRKHLRLLACALLALQLRTWHESVFVVSAVRRPLTCGQHLPSARLVGCTWTCCDEAWKEPDRSANTALRGVLISVSAGIVAATVQAALSEAEVMKHMRAMKETKLSLVLQSFGVALLTNLVKFPFFEAVYALVVARVASPLMAGALAGFLFTTATLPITNYWYRKSLNLDVKWEKLYEAYLPTLLRDVAYGILRSYATLWITGLRGHASPAMLFLVVFMACLGSSPFNQWRTFLLQHHTSNQPIQEYFKPVNYAVCASWGALRQALSVGLGYWWAPAMGSFLSCR